MTSIDLNRGFPYLGGKAFDSRNNSQGSQQGIIQEINHLRLRKYGNSNFYLFTLDPNVEKYMRENLFLQSYERKNPVNEQADDLIKNLADQRINDLVKAIVGAQGEFVRRGKELVSYFSMPQKEVPIFNFIGKIVIKMNNEDSKNELRALLENFKAIRKNFVTFHSSRFFNNFDNHNTLGNYYINYANQMYTSIENLSADIKRILTNDITGGMNKEKDEFLENLKIVMANLYFVGEMLLRRKNAKYQFDSEIPEIKEKVDSLSVFFEQPDVLTVMNSTMFDDSVAKRIKNSQAFQALETSGGFINRELLDIEKKVVETIKDNMLSEIPILFSNGSTEIPRSEINEIISSINGDVDEWMDPFFAPKVNLVTRRKAVSEFPKSDAFQKLNSLNETIVSSDAKLVKFMVKEDIEEGYDYEIIIGTSDDFTGHALYRERNGYYTIVDTFKSHNQKIVVRESKAKNPTEFYKRDESIPDLYIFSKFNFVSLLNDNKYYFETFLSKKGPKISGINFSPYGNTGNSIPPRGNGPRETMEEILFHSYDYRERRHGKMYAVTYENSSGVDLVAFDKDKKYNLTKRSKNEEYLDEYTREALLYAANITKINTSLEVKGRDGNREKSIHSNNFFITVSVVRPNEYFYEVRTDIPYDIKICATNIYPYLPIINLHHKHITHSREAPNNTRVIFRDPVWMQKFATPNESEGVYNSVEVQDYGKSRNTGATLVYSTPKQFVLDILSADGKFSVEDFADKLNRQNYTWNGYSVRPMGHAKSIVGDYDSRYLSALVSGATPRNVDPVSLNKILKSVSATIFNKLMHYFFSGEKFIDFSFIMNQPKHNRHDFMREKIEVSKNYSDNDTLRDYVDIQGESKQFMFSNIKKESSSKPVRIYVGTVDSNKNVTIDPYLEDVYRDIVKMKNVTQFDNLWTQNKGSGIQFYEDNHKVYFEINFDTYKRKFDVHLASKVSDSWKIDIGTITKSEYRDSLDPFDYTTGNRKKVGKVYGSQMVNFNESYTTSELNKFFNIEGRKVVVRDNSLFLEIDHTFWLVRVDKNTSISRVIKIENQQHYLYDKMLRYIKERKVIPKQVSEFENWDTSSEKIGISDNALKEFLFELFFMLIAGKSKQEIIEFSETITEELLSKILNLSSDRLVSRIYELETSSGLTYVEQDQNFLYYKDKFYPSGNVRISKIFIEKRPMKFTLTSSFDSDFTGDVKILNLKNLSFIDSILGKNIVSKLISLTKKLDITPAEIGTYLYEKLTIDPTERERMERLTVLFESIGLTVNNTSARNLEQNKNNQSPVIYFKEGAINWK